MPQKRLKCRAEMALVEEADFRRDDRSRHAREQQRLRAPDRARRTDSDTATDPNCCRNTVAKRDTLSADSSASCASVTGSSKCASMNASASSRLIGCFMGIIECTESAAPTRETPDGERVERNRRAARIDEFGQRLADARPDLEARRR